MLIRRIVAVLATTTLLALTTTATADAAVGPRRLQWLAQAQAQTQLLLGTYVEGATVSPPSCTEHRHHRHHRQRGVYLLPTLSFNRADATLSCQISSRNVLVDLGGVVATEDATGSTYTTLDGRMLTFEPKNLESICDDVLAQSGGPAPVTLDGRLLGVGTAVSTPPVVATVQPACGPYYRDSGDVGHPGQLAASYCGWKSVLHLRPGQHQLVVDLTRPGGVSTVLTYWICVR